MTQVGPLKVDFVDYSSYKSLLKSCRAIAYKLCESEDNNCWNNANIIYQQHRFKTAETWGDMAYAMANERESPPDFAVKYVCNLESFNNGKYSCIHSKENNICRRHTWKQNNNYYRRRPFRNNHRGRGRGRPRNRNGNNGGPKQKNENNNN